MDRLEAMSLLVAAAAAGSLSAAGRRLGVPLPTVSRKISELEAHLNARLLTRSTRRLALTDAGQAYVAAAKRILEEIGEAERAASGASAAPSGELLVTAPIVFGRLHVLPVISDFLVQWPAINVRLSLSDHNLNFIDDRLDVAVRIGALKDSALSATRVGEVRLVVCGSPAFFATHGVPSRPEDLSAMPAVTFDPFSPTDHWDFPGQKSKRDLRAPIRSRLSVNTAEAAIDAAAAGVGVTRVLSYQAAEAARQGKIQIVLAGHEPPPAPVNLVHLGRALMPLKARMLLDFATPRLKARLA